MRRPARRGVLPLLLGLAFLAAPGQAGADSAAEQLLASEPPELAERLLREKLIVLEDVHKSDADAFVVAYVIFEQPRREVLALVTQSKRQIEYRPELRSIEVVEDGPDGRVDEHRMKIMFKSIVYRLRYTRHAETDRIAWGLDPRFENDLERLDGFWEFYEFGPDRTLGRFGSIVSVGRAVPRFIQDGMTRKTVLKTVENCRHWVDSGGRWRP